MKHQPEFSREIIKRDSQHQTLLIPMPSQDILKETILKEAERFLVRYIPLKHTSCSPNRTEIEQLAIIAHTDAISSNLHNLKRNKSELGMFYFIFKRITSLHYLEIIHAFPLEPQQENRNR